MAVRVCGWSDAFRANTARRAPAVALTFRWPLAAGLVRCSPVITASSCSCRASRQRPRPCHACLLFILVRGTGPVSCRARGGRRLAVLHRRPAAVCLTGRCVTRPAAVTAAPVTAADRRARRLRRLDERLLNCPRYVGRPRRGHAAPGDRSVGRATYWPPRERSFDW